MNLKSVSEFNIKMELTAWQLDGHLGQSMKLGGDYLICPRG